MGLVLVTATSLALRQMSCHLCVRRPELPHQGVRNGSTSNLFSRLKQLDPASHTSDVRNDPRNPHTAITTGANGEEKVTSLCTTT